MTEDLLPLVSALFLSYNRYELLEQAVRGFLAHTGYPNLEVVISDNGSHRDVQTKIRKLPADVFAMMPKNLGLGASNNNGIQNCRGKYVLMIQDDWLCHGPSDYLRNAVAVMEANPNVGIVNFAGANHPPDLNQRLKGSDGPCYVTPVPLLSHKEEFLYCDQPHLQSHAALDYIGPYLEDHNIGRSEIDYSLRWKQQTRFRTAVFPAYFMRVFSNEGEDVNLSFRQQELSYRMDRLLMPAAQFLKNNCEPLYKLGRATVRSSVALIEKVQRVR